VRARRCLLPFDEASAVLDWGVLFGVSFLATLISAVTLCVTWCLLVFLKLVPLRTHLMVADALTKSLRSRSPAHTKHREIMLGHVPVSFAACPLYRTVGGGGESLSVYSCFLFVSFPAVTVGVYCGALYFFSFTGQ
jgi:hypothetical protein